MPRVLSGVQPSGEAHIGNYLGAFRQWVANQHERESFHCIVDLHALTLEISPEELRRRTTEAAITLLAVGLDPDVATIFVQSHVPEHPRLAWLLECTATMGELRRMTQFKEKGGGRESVRVGLFTYPALQAADILLYRADLVPVGDDQRQHVELTRDLAIRFNHHYGDVFTVPEPEVPTIAARVMDLQHPERKMSKSIDSPLGTVGIFDDPKDIEKKVRRAVTDTDDDVVYDTKTRPGVANLLDLLAASTGGVPTELATRYTRYGDIKRDVAEALIELLRPVRERAAELQADRGAIERVLTAGAAKAHAVAEVTYAKAAEAIGLLPA